MAQIPNRPTELGYALGRNLARFADVEEARKPDAPKRCGTCAFRDGTIPNGCEATVMDALKCTMELGIFYCHEDKAGETACAGWNLLKTKLKDVVPCPWDYSSPPTSSGEGGNF